MSSIPGDVLEVVRLVAGLSKIVGPVEETGDAGIERQRVRLTLKCRRRDLVLGKLRHIDGVGQRLEGAWERLKILLRNIVLDQNDVRQAIGRAGEKLRLQLLPDVILRSRVDDVERNVGMRFGVDGASFPHGHSIEVRVPAPDGQCGRGCGSADGRQRGDGDGNAERPAPADGKRSI